MSTWDRTIDLYYDVERAGSSQNPLLAIEGDSVSDGAAPRLVQGDCFSLRLFFRHRISGDVTNATLPADTALIWSGKKTKTMAESVPLFSATAFAQEGEGDDACWVAACDLNTTPIIAALGSDAEIAVRIDLEVQNTGNTRRMTFQIDATLRRQTYAGEGDPASGDPVYPLPSALVVKYIGGTAITSGAQSVAVSGLALDFTPATVLQSIRKPSAGADHIVGSVLDDSISSDGFTVELNAPCPGDGYKLDYLLIEEAS